MFTTNSVLSSVRKGDYAFKIDLQDAYFHVPIHPSSRKYLRFAFENKVYQFQVLPFCLNTAPQVFTRLGHTVTGYLHRQGISMIPYLDDWLIHHPDRQVLLRHQAPLRGGALTWGIPRFRVPGPVQTASSISIVWSSKR